MLLTVHLALAAPKQELQVIRKQIGALEQNRLSTKKTRTEILRAIKKSAISINNINHSLGLLNQKKQAVNAQLLSIKQNIRQISSTIITQQHNLDLQLLHQYESGKEEQARILFNGENAGSINRDLVYYHYLAEARSNAIQSLQTNIERLKQLNGLEESKNQQISAIQSRQQKQQHQLLAEEAKHQKYAAELNQRIKTQDQEIARLHHDEQRLTLLIKKLNALRRQRMEKRHAVSINRKGIASNNYLPSGRYAGRDFVKLRGHLRLPVIGEIMNRFGSRRPETGTIWHGIFIKAPEGSPVKAVASGEVVYAGSLRGFGKLIIISHGDGYMSLYADNEKLLRKTGDKVQAGDTIALVGATGDNPEPGLYFELRHQSVPFNPLSWSNIR